MALRTWEVKLLAGNNGVIQTSVQADDWDTLGEGLVLYKEDETGRQDVAFFPYDKLLSVKDVTP